MNTERYLTTTIIERLTYLMLQSVLLKKDKFDKDVARL